MKIEVQLFASLGRYAPEGSEAASFEVHLGPGATVADLLGRLRVPRDVVKLVFVNGVHAAEQTALQEGDRVGVFPPVAGG